MANIEKANAHLNIDLSVPKNQPVDLENTLELAPPGPEEKENLVN